jgi:hypothetical protein
MDLKKLVTLTFDKNVGPRDQVFRLVSGTGLLVAGGLLSTPFWLSTLLVLLGAMWTLSGVLSAARCDVDVERSPVALLVLLFTGALDVPAPGTARSSVGH